ncbi:MAG: tRNA (adenosine(37)-N6)-dimethylallyltransferase MiaA, partial [Desulfofustis sp.]|nr:tRNA (adenosine(37)-N6)-dimethylallyltransferase MiaA [Desulfofustis sp.]
DIGTAKATREERSSVPHHLIDIVDPDDEYNAAHFTRDALQAIQAIHGRGALPVLTGGSGLYLKALKNGLFTDIPTDASIRENLKRRIAEEGSHPLHRELSVHDPVSAASIHPNDAYRIARALEVFLSSGIPLSSHFKQQGIRETPIVFANLFSIGLTSARPDLYRRIEKRSAQMLAEGLEEEVRTLLDRGYDPTLKSMQSIGYRHMVHYITGSWTLEETAHLLTRDTRHYAKRQFTWFKKDHSLIWKDTLDQDGIVAMVGGWLDTRPPGSTD